MPENIMNALISVIIPVYNVEAYLDECMESVCGQTYRNLEIILIDDGSTDGSSDICDKWARKDLRVKVIHQKNAGLSSARNVGLGSATGDFIAFLDSDDYLERDAYDKVVRALQKHGTDIVVFDYMCVNDKGERLSDDRIIESRIIDQKEALLELYKGFLGDYVPFKVYSKKLWNSIRFPIGKAFEDIGTMYKVFLQADSICCISDKLYYYRRRSGSIIAQMSDKALCDLFELRKKDMTI